MATSKTADDGLPVVRSAKRDVVVRAHLEEFGRTWDLIRPNQLIAAQLMGGDDGQIDPSYISRYFKAHVHPDQQEEFIAAALNDPSLEVEDFMDLIDRMTKAVYGDDLPSPPS